MNRGVAEMGEVELKVKGMGIAGTDMEQFEGIAPEKSCKEEIGDVVQLNGGCNIDPEPIFEKQDEKEGRTSELGEAGNESMEEVPGLVEGVDANVPTVDSGLGVSEKKEEQEDSIGVDLTVGEERETDVREVEGNMNGRDKGAEDVKSEDFKILHPEIGQGSIYEEKDENGSNQRITGENTKERRDEVVCVDEVADDGVKMLESENARPYVPEKQDEQENELNDTAEVVKEVEIKRNGEDLTVEVIQAETVNMSEAGATEESGGNGSEQDMQIIEETDAKSEVVPMAEAISASNLKEENDTIKEEGGESEKPDETNRMTIPESDSNLTPLSEKNAEEESSLKNTEGIMKTQIGSKTVVGTDDIQMIDVNAVSGTLLEQKGEENYIVETSVAEEKMNQDKGINIVELENVNMFQAYTGPEAVLEETIKDYDIETVGEAVEKNEVEHSSANMEVAEDVNIPEAVDTESRQSKLIEGDDISNKLVVVEDAEVPEVVVRERAEDAVNMHPPENVNTRKYYDAYKVEVNGTKNEEVEGARAPESIDKVVPVEEGKMLAAETVILPVVKDEKSGDIQDEARKGFEETNSMEEKIEPREENKAVGESVKRNESSVRKKKEKLEKNEVRIEEIEESTSKMEVDAEEYLETEKDFKMGERKNKQAKTSSRKRSRGKKKRKKMSSQKKGKELLSALSDYGIEMKKSLERYEDKTNKKKDEKQELNEEGTEKAMQENARKEEEDAEDDLMEMEENSNQSDEENEEAKPSSTNQRSGKRTNEVEDAKQKKVSQDKEKEKEVSFAPVTSPSDRPVRERKSVERLVEVLEREQVKIFVIEKGCGIPLKEIPHVAHRLSRKKPSDLKMLHQILFGRVGKAVDFKNHILQFSGFPWHESEEKQRTKTKEKLDKYVKDTLLELCDLFGLHVTSRSSIRKEEIVAMLLDFIAVPQTTEHLSPSNKEQRSTKSRKRKRVGTGSGSKSSEGIISAKWSRKKRSRKESTSKAKGKSDYESEEEDDEDAENDVHEKDEASSMPSEPDGKETDYEVDNCDSEKSDENSRRNRRSSKIYSKSKSGSILKTKTISSPKRTIIPCSTSAAPSRKSVPKHSEDDMHEQARTKVFSRKKRIDPPKKKSKSTMHVEEKRTSKAVAKDKAKSKGLKETWPSKEELRKTICEILDRVDFNTATFTDILKLLTGHYDTDLTSKKIVIKHIIQEELTRLANEVDDDGGSDEDDSPKPKRRHVAA